MYHYYYDCLKIKNRTKYIDELFSEATRYGIFCAMGIYFHDSQAMMSLFSR